MGRSIQGLPNELLAVIAVVFIIPAVVSALPSRLTPVPRLIAPLLQTILPKKVELLLIVTAPCTTQYTLFAWAPLIRVTLEKALVERAPLICIMKIALASPSALR